MSGADLFGLVVSLVVFGYLLVVVVAAAVGGRPA